MHPKSIKRSPDGGVLWHVLSADQVEQRLDATSRGLEAEEAARRLERHGPNRLPQARRRGPLVRFLAQFANLLIYVLLAAAAVTAMLGHLIDAGVIVGVVAINAIIGFIQEGRAERSLESLRSLLSQRATVIRDGRRTEVAAEDLVPGDLVLVESGDRVPADLRLIEARGLSVQEAMLTGESLPAEKLAEPVGDDAPLGDRQCMAYSGTLVARGRGVGLAVATGADTELGRISAMLAEVTTLTTPLLAQMSRFAQTLTVAILGLAAVTFAYGAWVRGLDLAEMFMAAVGIAVAAIPEGLPAVMTITLALGVERMARRRAIIRRLPAVETLGSVTTICSDKTGTLTRNEMTVEAVAVADALFTVDGAGYAPQGGFRLAHGAVEPGENPLLPRAARGALLCSDADVVRRSGEWVMTGDPTEGALVTLALKAGLDPARERAAWPRRDVIPFESERRYMATLHHELPQGGPGGGAGGGTVYVKGAPERLIDLCDRQLGAAGPEPLDPGYWHGRMGEIAARGARVLGLAMRPVDAGRYEIGHDDVAGGLILVALFGLADPPRPEAVAAVARCRGAGIAVKMITGDHAATAQAIGAEVGLAHAESALTGPEIDGLDDVALARRVAKVDVFARTSPAHKLRLVQALQANGEVVSMTGDGVNDAPALKRADVGVAMGCKGTDAAREAAEMVLSDDNFASIAHAVEEGRTVYANLRKAIAFILPTNGGEALALVAAIAAGTQLPITPVQILWINMITAVTLGLALAFEPGKASVMNRPPRRRGAPLLSGFLVWRIVFVALVMVAGTLGLFLWELESGSDLATARTVAVNTLVLFEVFYLLNCRSLHGFALGPSLMRGSRTTFLAIAIVLVFQMLMTYAGPFQVLFDTRAIPFEAWLRAAAVAASVFVLVELEKLGASLWRRR